MNRLKALTLSHRPHASCSGWQHHERHPWHTCAPRTFHILSRRFYHSGKKLFICPPHFYLVWILFVVNLYYAACFSSLALSWCAGSHVYESQGIYKLAVCHVTWKMHSQLGSYFSVSFVPVCFSITWCSHSWNLHFMVSEWNGQFVSQPYHVILWHNW